MLFDESTPVGGTFLDMERAQKWDERISKLENNVNEKAKNIADLLNLNAESTVVDLGCGTGFFTLEIAKFCKEVYAVDISPIMLEILGNKIKKGCITNVECVNSGILDFLSKHDHADALILQASFHHLPDFWKAVAIHHMGRILITGNKVYLSDVIFSFPVSDYMKHFNDMLNFIATKGDDGLTKDATNHLLQEYSTFDWIIEGMFQRSGFSMTSKTGFSTHFDYVFTKN